MAIKMFELRNVDKSDSLDWSATKLLVIISLGYFFRLDDESEDKINGILNRTTEAIKNRFVFSKAIKVSL